MPTAVYIRVSDKDQNLDSQRVEITRWLERNGHKDVKWYEDKQTGKNTARPGFQRLRKAVIAGKVDTVIVWKLDRLARRFRDGILLVTDWVGRGVRIVSVTQQIDLNGVLGQLVAAVLFAFAEIELDTSKERQAVGIAEAKLHGKYTGRKAGTTKAKPDRARELHKQGLSAREIGAALNVSEWTVRRYLADK